ncbi:hypothetical protein H2248_002290 [Termitomyces sp. 'cryptogamus']|nr:hypothetical protein H2248_002290 [Termitomyces sp. 'cryptogamus']
MNAIQTSRTQSDTFTPTILFTLQRTPTATQPPYLFHGFRVYSYTIHERPPTYITVHYDSTPRYASRIPVPTSLLALHSSATQLRLLSTPATLLDFRVQLPHSRQFQSVSSPTSRLLMTWPSSSGRPTQVHIPRSMFKKNSAGVQISLLPLTIYTAADFCLARLE